MFSVPIASRKEKEGYGECELHPTAPLELSAQESAALCEADVDALLDLPLEAEIPNYELVADPLVEQLPELVRLKGGKEWLLVTMLHELAFATCVIEPLGITASIAPTAIIVTKRKLNFHMKLLLTLSIKIQCKTIQNNDTP